jgi:hypothetical protein
MQIALVKTLAQKRKISASTGYQRYRGIQTVNGYEYKTLQVEIPTPKGSRTCIWGAIPLHTTKPDTIPIVDSEYMMFWKSRPDLVTRLLADICELCGSLLKKSLPSTRPGKRLSRLSERLKFHLGAQTGALTNQTFLRSLTIPFFKEGFTLLPIGRLPTYKVRENDQDTVSDGCRSAFRPSSFGEATRLLSEIALFLMRGRMSSLNEKAS